MLLNALSIVASIFLMMAVGFALRRWGFFRGNAPDLLSKLVMLIAMPATTAAQMFRHYTRQTLVSGLPVMGIGFLSVGILYLISVPVSKLARIPQGRKGVFRALFTFGNTIFIGLPVNTALFGEAALPATLLYYIANTTLFWTLGSSGIMRDGGHTAGFFRPETLRRVFSPPLLAFIISGLLIFAGFRPPAFVQDTLGYIGGLVTPLSLFFVGTLLCDMLGQGIRWQRGYGWMILSSFLLSPALILSLMYLLGGSMPPLYRAAFLVQASMPAQTSCAIVAYSYGADAQYATGGVTVTTLLSIVSIPLFAVLTTVL